MASISSTGIGSGLDVNKIVKDLRTVEERPLTLLENQATLVEAKISAFGEVQSLFSSLSDAANKLAEPATWTARTVSSSNSAAVSATASTGAAATSFSVQVEQLAQAQVSATTVVAAGKTLGAGTLSLQLGTWGDVSPTGSQFNARSGVNAVEISIPAGTSLSGVAAQINQAEAGVTATVVAGTDGPRLLLKSTSTGEAMGFQMTTTDAADPPLGADQVALSSLVLDRGTPESPAPSMQYATDAKAFINGLEVKSASNTLTTAVEGVTLTLNQKTAAGSPAQINITEDTATMQKAIEDFVIAYNAANTMISNLTSYDSTAKPGEGGSLLQGDSTMLALQRQMSRIAGGVVDVTGPFKNLTDVGIGLPKSTNGKVTSTNLELDTAKLKSALANPGAVRALFTADTGNSATEGVALQFKRMCDAVLGTQGAFATTSEALESQKTSLTDQQERVLKRVDAWEERVRKQYASLDIAMGKINSLNTYITQQVEQWNKSSK